MIYKNLELFCSIIKFDGKVKKIYFKSNLILKKKKKNQPYLVPILVFVEMESLKELYSKYQNNHHHQSDDLV